MNPGSVIAVGAWGGLCVWLGFQTLERAAWLYGRVARAWDDHVTWPRDQRRAAAQLQQARDDEFTATEDRLHREAYEATSQAIDRERAEIRMWDELARQLEEIRRLPEGVPLGW